MAKKLAASQSRGEEPDTKTIIDLGELQRTFDAVTRAIDDETEQEAEAGRARLDDAD